MQAHTILTISTALLIASISTAHGDLLNVELRKAYAECKTSQEACESICKQAIIARKKATADAEDKTQQCIMEHKTNSAKKCFSAVHAPRRRINTAQTL